MNGFDALYFVTNLAVSASSCIYPYTYILTDSTLAECVYGSWDGKYVNTHHSWQLDTSIVVVWYMVHIAYCVVFSVDHCNRGTTQTCPTGGDTHNCNAPRLPSCATERMYPFVFTEKFCTLSEVTSGHLTRLPYIYIYMYIYIYIYIYISFWFIWTDYIVGWHNTWRALHIYCMWHNTCRALHIYCMCGNSYW